MYVVPSLMLRTSIFSGSPLYVYKTLFIYTIPSGLAANQGVPKNAPAPTCSTLEGIVKFASLSHCWKAEPSIIFKVSGNTNFSKLLHL